MATIDYWQKLINQNIPISKALDFQLVTLDDNRCISTAKLANNINIHNTAFAGSLYSLCTLNAWVFFNHQLKTAGLNADVVLSRGNITYQHPVNTDIRCECYIEDLAQVKQVLACLHDEPRGKLRLQTVIHCQNQLAVKFSGDFVAIKN